VKYQAATLDSVFHALADPTRRAITDRLARGEASVSELAEPFALTLPGVTRHLAVLEHAGLITHRKVGRVRRCRLVAAPLKEADDWIARYSVFWNARLDELAAHVEREERPGA
jgi:DNA-binding transcriptional ArsR family regulator